jgi:hypothetical protein
MPTVMCTRNLWRALGGRGQLGLREPGRSERGKLCVWSVRELFTRKMALAIGLEETTYLTVVFPLASSGLTPRCTLAPLVRS